MEEDQMDIDPIVEIPDTPDRFANSGMKWRSSVRVETNHSPLAIHGQRKFFEEGSRDQPMIIDSGSRGSPLHLPKRTNSPSNSRQAASLSSVSSLSSQNGHLFRKGVTEKIPRHTDFKHKEHQDSMRPSCSQKSSSSQNDGFIDLTKRNLHIPVVENTSTSGLPGNNGGDIQRKSGLANGTSSRSMKNFPVGSSNANEGTSNVRRVGSSVGSGEGADFVGGNNKESGNGNFLSLEPIASPRVHRQKRLVRNGCISPNNIAKAKQLVAKDVMAHDNGSVVSSAPPVSVDIMELVAEDSESQNRKGKGVISLPCTSKGPELSKNLNNSRDVSKSIEESSGWRSTRNRTREINMSRDKGHYLIRERDTPKYPTQHHENRLERREKGSSIASGEEPSLISSENIRPLRGPVSHPRARLGRLNGPRSPADSLIKRQKQGSTSSSPGECSTSVADDPDIVLLSSSAEAGNLNSTSSNVDNQQKVIEVDEFPPQSRQNAHDEDVRARQLEADELMALELQEQFYNEMPVFGEVDEHIPHALHQEGVNHGSSRARRTLPDARLIPNLNRPSQSRSSSNAPRRGAVSRASALGRMTRLRSRFPGQPRSLLPLRGRTSMFPPDMDVDMRMHILGALEEFSDMGMNAGILQADRDFNEDDYEMLLALDENNHRHGGASVHQINGLPQSTVQSDYEEACAICLDIPTVGDTIRHLPCLHKFHKDCIDPWLRRKTSCPVCKSSIT